ncbi:MAG: sigma 54-interacting transcriptional regulator [Clostridiales Family XIII bacterium]|jgi:PAS domain S-box-containing protein|nr:sigma 54-interacting transcriptional regulator [Clostridiales Family XIII bacterium]
MSGETIEALQNRIKDLELAINFTHDGLHLLDEKGNTIFVNTSCEINEGLVWEKIKGKSIRRLMAEGFISDSVTLKVLEQNTVVTLIQKVKSGKEMLVTGVPIHDEHGKIFRVMVNSRDITELNLYKKQLAETEVRFQITKNKLIGAQWDAPIVCKSPRMQKVFDMAFAVSRADSNVLITGESGTGKGVVSKFIHDNCKERRDKPYVKIDCGSLPESLFESELFGYEEGAFTGASAKGKIGLMEIADGGTLFLDEIGELSLNSQSKILRAIQDKEIMRIGGKDVIRIDVRIIAATNRDLEKMVEAGAFREDLFYRISVIPIHIPPLRDRKEDIQELVLNAGRRFCEKYGFDKRIDMEAMERLLAHEWKGNVRELENLIERIFVVTDKNIIGAEDLPQNVRNSGARDLTRPGDSLKEMLNDYEKRILEEMVRRDEHPQEIARKLKMDPTSIRRKLAKHKLSYSAPQA